MLRTILLALAATVLSVGTTRSAHAQVIGSYDNFDCFNDTGQEAEGFEIDVEDVGPSDVTRIFPDNFPAGQPYIRYATPDKNALTPTTFPDGHTGVRIVYAAAYQGGQWVTQWGSSTMPGTAALLGNGTPYVRNPTYSTGDSCWTLGLRDRYPTSGCEHFGISLAAGVVPGKTTYHWLVPDPANPGQLIQHGAEASLPPSPVLAPVPGGDPRVVHAVAEAPENENEGLFGEAFWVKTFTSFGRQPVDLDELQKGLVPMRSKIGQRVKIAWHLVQRAPAGADGERAEIEDEAIPAGNVQVTKRYEYYRYNGAYDPESHEATCGGDQSCDRPVVGLNGKFERGKFVGAHMNAYEVQ